VIGLTDRPYEARHRPAIRADDFAQGCVGIERRRGDAVRTCAARHRGDQRDLAAVAQLAVGRREFLIDREAQLRRDGLKGRVARARGGQGVAGRRSLGQLQISVAAPARSRAAAK